jgi:hypothetical protein
MLSFYVFQMLLTAPNGLHETVAEYYIHICLHLMLQVATITEFRKLSQCWFHPTHSSAIMLLLLLLLTHAIN